MLDVIFDNQNHQYQSLVIPEHYRTIKSTNENRLVKIPKSIALGAYFKPLGILIPNGIYDFDLNYRLNFGHEVCTNGRVMHSLTEYLTWYWQSTFLGISNHQKISLKEFRKCYFTFYHLAINYNPAKIIEWKQVDKMHIKCCPTCRESLTFKERFWTFR